MSNKNATTTDPTAVDDLQALQLALFFLDHDTDDQDDTDDEVIQ